MNLGKDLVSPELTTQAATWVIEAARLPLAFAQVREDALLDQWVVERLEPDAEVLMIASGGCTAALLATMPQVSRLHLIDQNPAQIGLSRLKLRLLAVAEPSERLSILGHAPMSARKRRLRLIDEFHALNLSDDAIGPIHLISEKGPDRAGRYEFLFAKLCEALSGIADELTALLQLRDPAEQSRRANPMTPLGNKFDSAFDSVMTLPNLVGLFGSAATRNRCEPFSRHFARRTRHILATLPAADNPYLWQMLKGQFPDGVTYPWLKAPTPARMPELFWSTVSMTEALQRSSQAFDLIHLSNILDWLDPEAARQMLALTWKALRPGGRILIRQLNSHLDIQSLGQDYQWESQSSKAMHDCDRSFFYRALHLGRKT